MDFNFILCKNKIESILKTNNFVASELPMGFLSVKWKSKNNQKEFFNEGCDDNGVNEEHDECDHSNKLINRWFNESVFF